MSEGFSGVRTNLVFIVLAVAAAGAGYLIHQSLTDTAPLATKGKIALVTPSEVLRRPRPDFSLPNLQGERISIGRWDGDVVLVNFWATWCPPCRKEIPAFIEVLERYQDRGFQIVGVAIDDPESVKAFVDDLGARYPQLIGEMDAIEVSRQYGNRHGTLPFSVLIDREGMIRFLKPGELHRDVLEDQLKRLL